MPVWLLASMYYTLTYTPLGGGLWNTVYWSVTPPASWLVHAVPTYTGMDHRTQISSMAAVRVIMEGCQP